MTSIIWSYAGTAQSTVNVKGGVEGVKRPGAYSHRGNFIWLLCCLRGTENFVSATGWAYWTYIIYERDLKNIIYERDSKNHISSKSRARMTRMSAHYPLVKLYSHMAVINRDQTPDHSALEAMDTTRASHVHRISKYLSCGEAKKGSSREGGWSRVHLIPH